MPVWLTEIGRLRSELPPEVDAILRRHEDAGTTESEEYQATMMAFYERHVCRVPWPDWLQRTFQGLAANPEVYNTMNGPSEFHVIGPLKDFDITADLGRIAVPTRCSPDWRCPQIGRMPRRLMAALVRSVRTYPPRRHDRRTESHR